MARRASRRRSAVGAGVQQLSWRQVENQYRPIEVLSDDQLEAICDAAYRILEQVGMDFLHDESKTLFRQAGAEVLADSDRVRIDRELVRKALARAPATVALKARNPAHDLYLGAGRVVFGSVASAPNASDIEHGRRSGNQQDFQNFLKLIQSLNIIHCTAGYPVEPVDLAPRTRHLDCIRDMAVLTDKVYHAYSLGRERISDALEITRIAHRCSAEEFTRHARLFTIINTSSPLRLDGVMIDGALEMARHNQLCVITPFTLSGAMSPVTLAGALAQQHAEAIAAITLLQLAAPGAPVMYGGFTSNVDMKSGAPAFGTPEYARAALVGGQLARRINIPYRSSNVNTANCVDPQATYESQTALWAAVMGHANLVMHGAGWLEGGLCASFEKFIVDAEMLQMMAEFLRPIEVNETALGLEAIRDVGPGGHFFGTPHTLERFETAFYAPLLSDWSNFETWQENGAQTATQRAHKLYKRLLAEYRSPPLDSAAAEEIDAFVARRKAEGGIHDAA